MHANQQNVQSTLRGIVNRVTFHNDDTGWSVLRVDAYDRPGSPTTVTVHQTRVFAGATMEFRGHWVEHPRFGEQFKALTALEQKPASAAGLERYLGSGLIAGVGPKTAQKIVKHFGDETLPVFESDIGRLTEVPGIAKRKLLSISEAWDSHRNVRDVMIFLQSHGISTLFAVKIYKQYGNSAIDNVRENPYRLSTDIYGIGFFSADRVARALGISVDDERRLAAAIKHVLAASREMGHCYLTRDQIVDQCNALLELQESQRYDLLLHQLASAKDLALRHLQLQDQKNEVCYYSKSLYYDEDFVAQFIRQRRQPLDGETARIQVWVERYCKGQALQLSNEQQASVVMIATTAFAILTGGPGCGKTTTTRVIVKLFEAMGKRLLLAAPTGRAAQRMGEVIGNEAKTLHRLLKWTPATAGFLYNETNPLQGDVLIVDECSMLDITLAANLLRAVPDHMQVIFIGDADQLPSVGAGNVLRDCIASQAIPVARLTQVFRQAAQSDIIRFAHSMNQGKIPRITSPFRHPEVWKGGSDCLFIDASEATQAQLTFIKRVKKAADVHGVTLFNTEADDDASAVIEGQSARFVIPDKFTHVAIDQLLQSRSSADELRHVLRHVSPWSSLHYGLTAQQMLRRLVVETIPRYLGKDAEIQVLSPMKKGSLGSLALNGMLQEALNPASDTKREVKLGERCLRVGDRVIQKRNNYDLGVFNGDIGRVVDIDTSDATCLIEIDNRTVEYGREALPELELAYSITIHKSQGSEFDVVILPVMTQHFKMLARNLIYTGLTRAKKLAVFVGSRQAMVMAVQNQQSAQRQTALRVLLQAP